MKTEELDWLSEDFQSNIRGCLDLQEVSRVLGYDDLRSAMTWCRKKGVLVFTQGKRKLVNRTQFVMEFHRPFIEQLRKLYPKRWGELFNSFLKGDVQEVMGVVSPDIIPYSGQYKPESDEAKRFLDKVNKL